LFQYVNFRFSAAISSIDELAIIERTVKLDFIRGFVWESYPHFFFPVKERE